MSEIRQDPTTKEWVIMAPERRKRLDDTNLQLIREGKSSTVNACPFCPGNENLTPPEVLSFKGSGTNSWQVRVFPNKFPAVSPEGNNSKRIEHNGFLSMEGIGCHEVIVESPIHNKSLVFMTDAEIAMVLRAYRQRYRTIAQMPYIKSIIIFKNHGVKAGTSLGHPHSQLVATAVVPGHIRRQYEVAISYYDDNGRCLYSDLAARELETKTRIVLETDRFTVFHPFASHRPFETWIMPKTNHSSFIQTSEEDIPHLAQVLKTTLLKLHHCLDNPDYNLILDNPPVGQENSDFYQWHIRIIPRITESAGFEIGSGIFINTSLPEETALIMRGVHD